MICGVCGLERHVVSCVAALKAELARVQAENEGLRNRVTDLERNQSVTVPVTSSVTASVTKAKRNRAEYMRRYRAEHRT